MTTSLIQDFINSIPDKRIARAFTEIYDRTMPSKVDTAITAHAGGTKAAAQSLKSTCSFHDVTTVATAADSILLPPAKEGEFHFVKNSGAASMQVFGQGTDTIDSVATATGVEQLAGDGVMYYCLVPGNWLRIGGVSATEVFGAITANSIAGGDSSLGIAGQAAAQGGAVAIVGGTSSTAGNAGGAVTVTGGTPGATSAGGAATIAAGAGGATSGAGGVASVTGGAGTNGNSAGGNATVTGGAGQGTATGGNAVVTGGASGAGATGTGGAASLVGGASAATNGAGGAVSVTGGAGAGTGAGGNAAVTAGASGAGATGNGGTASLVAGAASSTNGNGGNVILTPGALAGTGISGMVVVNGVIVSDQGAPNAQTTAATLTIANILTGIVTGTHTAGSTQAYTLPTGTDTDAGVQMAADEAFDWVLINLSAAAADTITITANTAHTLVGEGIVQSAHASTGQLYGNSARFRTRKTAANTFVTYRIA